MSSISIEIVPQQFSICKVSSFDHININEEFCFICNTDEEKSLVCLTKNLPSDILECVSGWQAFRIREKLDFALTGVLADIAVLLAENKISIFAVSTFNTDYFLVRNENFDKTLNILAANDYEICK